MTKYRYSRKEIAKLLARSRQFPGQGVIDDLLATKEQGECKRCKGTGFDDEGIVCSECAGFGTFTHPTPPEPEAKRVEKEYRENRTSWRFFERKLKNQIGGSSPNYASEILLEILKELQHLNSLEK